MPRDPSAFRMERSAFRSFSEPLRWGLWATWLAIAGVGAVTVLDGPASGARGVVLAACAVAAVATAGIYMTARSRARLFDRYALWFLAAWSLVDVILIGVAASATGGAGSPFVFLYALPVLYFVALYPPGLQVGLLAATAVSYATAVVASGRPAASGDVALACIVVGLVTLLTFLFAGELRRRAEQHLDAQRQAERRSQLLAVLAVATSDLIGVNRDGIVERVLGAATGFGVETVMLWEVSDEDRTLRCTHHVGLPADYQPTTRPLDGGLVGRAILDGRTVMTDDYDQKRHTDRNLQAAGCEAAIAVPMRSPGGHVFAVLAAGTRRARSFTDEEIEAFELLAAHAAGALDVAQRYESHRQTVQRLERLDQLKDDFVATTSHELRTPVTVVGGASELLDARWLYLDESTKRELVGRIHHHTEALKDTIDSLTRFHDLQTDQFDLQLEPIRVADLLQDVCWRANGTATGHQPTWDAPAGVTAHADRTLLEHALDCLIDNAIRHTPPGTPVRAAANVRDELTVTITVADDGPGLPAEIVERLGQSFARGGDHHTRDTRGLGLGLAIVQRVLNLHDTELHVDTTPGRGTRISFDLVGTHANQLTDLNELRPRRPGRLTASPIIRLIDEPRRRVTT